MIPELIFITPGIDTSTTVRQLDNAADPSHEDFKEIFLASIHIDPPIVHAIRRLLDARDMRAIHFGRCTGLLHHVLGAACARGVEKVSFLCDFRRMESPWCQALGRCLRFGKIRKLVLQTHLTNELAKAMYEGLSNSVPSNPTTLMELSVAVSHASWQSIVLLSATLTNCTSLQKLSLNRNDLLYEMDEGKLSTLLRSLANHPSLKELCIQGSSCPPGGIHVIAEHLIGSHNCLERLDLSNHRFGMDPLEGMRCLSQALSTNTSLAFLSLAGHELNEEDIRGLCRALQSPGIKLQELCLNDCQIFNEGVSIIAQSLRENGMPSLKALWLNDNPFDERSAWLLVDGVQNNMEMECLLLPLNAGYAMNKVQHQLDFWLFLNRIGRRLLFSHQSVPPFLWAMLLERAVKLHSGNSLSYGHANEEEGTSIHHADPTNLQATAIFYLLQHGPIAFER